MKSKIKDTSSIIIKGFMVEKLNLKGNELLLYALIHGFSQDGESKFTGSLQYLSDWTNSTKQGVMKCLKSLEAKGFIVKFESYKNGIKFCEYHATEFNTLCNKVSHPMKQSFTDSSKQSLTPPMKQSLPNSILLESIELNNIDESKDYNKEIIEKSELEKTFDEYLLMRKAKGKAPTARAIELVKNNLKKLANGSESLAIKILEQSILNSWTDVYPLKSESGKFASQQDKVKSDMNNAFKESFDKIWNE